MLIGLCGLAHYRKAFMFKRKEAAPASGAASYTFNLIDLFPNKQKQKKDVMLSAVEASLPLRRSELDYLLGRDASTALSMTAKLMLFSIWEQV
ncbi:hypothetical protein [Hymenobacter sp. UYCo722]|uniref:hypothetical protein n=1 Tax=Hymenobacter sp. UYCo722 TaxID=3156335 RepID=UPI003397D242